MTIFKKIRKQANKNFPIRNRETQETKLKNEIKEWLENPKDMEELADIIIVAVDLANLNNVLLEDVVNQKISINAKRTWELLDDGTYQHIDKENITK